MVYFYIGYYQRPAAQHGGPAPAVPVDERGKPGELAGARGAAQRDARGEVRHRAAATRVQGGEVRRTEVLLSDDAFDGGRADC